MTYRIEDEPRPGKLQTIAVRPLWPLLGVMLGGTWLAWPWFVLNAVAVGSPTLWREILWVAGGFVGAAGLIVGLFGLVGAGILPEAGIPYAVIALVVWKLLVSYRVYMLQARTFELYEYFGGTVKNGLMVAVAALFLEPQLLGLLQGAEQTFWILLLR